MAPAVLRNDPALRKRPDLQESLDIWWGGDLWVPHEYGVEAYALDLTCASSTPLLLQVVQELGQGYNQALLGAVAERNFALVEELLFEGANATHALHAALCDEVEPEMVRLLAAWSPELDGCFPRPVVLTWAARACAGPPVIAHQERRGPRPGVVERLDMLLAEGADINAADGNGETALHIVAQRIREVDGVAQHSVCSTPCSHFACRPQHVWHVLTARGADAGVRDYRGRTPLQLLSRSQCRELFAAQRTSYATIHRVALQRRRDMSLAAATPRTLGGKPWPTPCQRAAVSEASCYRTPRPARGRAAVSPWSGACTARRSGGAACFAASGPGAASSAWWSAGGGYPTPSTPATPATPRKALRWP